MSIPLGQAAFVGKDDWDPDITYLDKWTVYDEGCTYYAKRVNKGKKPKDSPDDWQLMSQSADAAIRAKAELARDEAVTAKDEAVSAKTAAETARSGAEGARDAAAGSASAAAGSASDAAGSATAAATSETNAANSATAAQEAAASVDGPGLMAAIEAVNNQIETHPHDGTAEGGVKIRHEDLTGCPIEVDDYLFTHRPDNPAVRWPQTVWSQVPPGIFLTAAGMGYPLGATGGAASVGLLATHAPAHKHKFLGTNGAINGAELNSLNLSGTNFPSLPSLSLGAGNASNGYVTLSNEGEGTPHENRPPYLAVNIWRRTA